MEFDYSLRTSHVSVSFDHLDLFDGEVLEDNFYVLFCYLWWQVLDEAAERFITVYYLDHFSALADHKVVYTQVVQLFGVISAGFMELFE